MNQKGVMYGELAVTTGETVHLAYYEEDDRLEAVFGQNESATGIELTDQILLRLNRTTGRAVSVTLRHFSILAERTQYGPRSYPLEHIDNLPEPLQEMVLHTITTPPVNQLLKVSHVQISSAQQMPVAYIEPLTDHHQELFHYAPDLATAASVRETSESYEH